MARPLTRREFLATLGIGTAGLIVGCGGDDDGTPPLAPLDAEPATDTPPPPSATPTATSTSTPVPTPTPRSQGLETPLLMEGSEWETPAFIHSSGFDGPALVVLGGIHGNEPGGWSAADLIADWAPARGVLAVLPRANQKAIAGFLRLVDGEGDLNRQYPGDPDDDLPTSRLAAQITALAAELRAEVLLDLHESWSFYADREAIGFVNRQVNGTAFLGQTITGGVGPRSTIASELAERVNPLLANEREHFITRDGRQFRRNDNPTAGSNRGRSSLSLGGHVAGLTPVLVETGQEGQSVERRAEQHLMVVRATMEVLGL